MSWQASTDNVAVTGYTVYRNNTVVGTVSAPGFLDPGLAPNTNYTYRVAARDAAGNTSAQSSAIGATTSASTAVYNPCPPVGQPCAVMPLGDSITVGVFTPTIGGYRAPLFHLATAAGKNLTFVGTQRHGPTTVNSKPFPRDHEGHSGYGITDMGTKPGLHPLVAPAMQAKRPHIITLLIGGNDVNYNFDMANAPARLGALLDTIFATDPNVLVVVGQIVPMQNDAQTARIKAYNDGMVPVIKARKDAGKHVVMVDMYTPFVSNPAYKTEMMLDNSHPNDVGYAKMAEVWYSAISGLLR